MADIWFGSHYILKCKDDNIVSMHEINLGIREYHPPANVPKNKSLAQQLGIKSERFGGRNKKHKRRNKHQTR